MVMILSNTELSILYLIENEEICYNFLYFSDSERGDLLFGQEVVLGKRRLYKFSYKLI